MSLTRTPLWATHELHGFLRERAAAPFVWGGNDCCLFPADAILAMTGVDIAAEFRGRYTTAIGAKRAIRSVARGATVGDAVAWCAQQHGLAELPHPRCAQRGDLVVLEEDGRDMAGLVGLNGRELVAVGEGGLVTFPIEQVKRAWRV
jgi:hypothetical protein